MPGTDSENIVKGIGMSEILFKLGDDGSNVFATLSGIGASFDANRKASSRNPARASASL